MKRRATLALLASLPFASLVRAQSSQSPKTFDQLLDAAGELESLKTVIVSVDGIVEAQRAYHGFSIGGSTNIKSASKSIISALVGIAIDRKVFEGVDQPIASVLRGDFPADPDPRLQRVTIGNLLSMQAGMERMSGPNYGRWVSSRNWVRAALGANFVGEPGGQGMLYSTASTHLLSAMLTKAGGRSTLALARDWLAPLDGFSIAGWERDPQGIYLGGNQMAMSAGSLLAFGELYRRGGVTLGGERLISSRWIEQSWQRRTNSVFNGDGYGYCWFIKEMAGEQVFYAWGYGGQMLYIVPSRKLSVVMTSREDSPSARTGYRDELHGLLENIIRNVGA